MVKKFDVYFCEVRGSEKPCVIVSPDEMNEVLPYVLIAPITKNEHDFPCRIGLKIKGQRGQVAFDLIRAVAKSTLVRRAGALPQNLKEEMQLILKQMFMTKEEASE